MIISGVLGAAHPFTLLETILTTQRSRAVRELKVALTLNHEDKLIFVEGILQEDHEQTDSVEMLKVLAVETKKSIEFFEDENKSDCERLVKEIVDINTLLRHMRQRDYQVIKEFLRAEIDEKKMRFRSQIIVQRVIQEHSNTVRTGRDLKLLVRAEIDLLCLILKTIEAYAPS